ncbi:hypothetical protein CFN79_14305 [Chromobacterium vaccinii]|uniref:InvB/SpaK family type III secretion system chaperone n=1 Tax=Chromobacterium vaccinii TaxID=1108595 RepID=UPI000CE94205|nr:hypothetical protein [Chromobacterium vaccinii]AVG16928.1 hypothetical protein CFN79_14305 [Chromobacterium vaccinii]
MNPLSLSNHVGNRLSDLLCNAVVQLGLPREQLSPLDQQATLVVEFQDLPDVMLSQLNDRLWIWSTLPNLTESKLSAMASQALAVLCEPVEDIESGQLTLGRGENGFELKGLINIECLAQERGLLPALTGFRAQLDSICRAFDLASV